MTTQRSSGMLEALSDGLDDPGVRLVRHEEVDIRQVRGRHGLRAASEESTTVRTARLKISLPSMTM